MVYTSFSSRVAFRILIDLQTVLQKLTFIEPGKNDSPVRFRFGRMQSTQFRIVRVRGAAARIGKGRVEHYRRVRLRQTNIGVHR